MKPAQFVLVNGFSNLAWSRNDDYEDMYKRLINYYLLKNINLQWTKK